MKTKVLELEQKGLNFVEFEPLNEVELKETEGGWFWPAVAGAIIGAILSQDMDSLVEAFNEGYNQGRQR